MLPRIIITNFARNSLLSRVWRGQSGKLEKPTEEIITDVLKLKFPKAFLIEVNDVSGGCGAMFEVTVLSVEFKGLNTVTQHRLINDSLKEQIKDMHGIRIRTGLPQP